MDGSKEILFETLLTQGLGDSDERAKAMSVANGLGSVIKWSASGNEVDLKGLTAMLKGRAVEEFGDKDKLHKLALELAVSLRGVIGEDNFRTVVGDFLTEIEED